MPKKLLRWGLLSTARINRALIPAIRASKRCQLVAVGSRTQEQADSYARQWEIPRAHRSYEALLADPEIDVIFNPLPNSLHAEWTIAAAQAGKHVLCEKPLAVTVTEVDAMAETAAKAGVVVAEAFMYRHHPQTRKVLEIAASGILGNIELIRGAYTYTNTRQNDVRLDPALGGGSLWDVGCYPVSYSRAIAGADPVEVFGWQDTGPTGIDLTLVGQMRFANGVYAQFDCGFKAPFRAFVEIVGSQASLQIPTPFKPGRSEKIFLTRGEEVETIKIKGQDLYTGEVEDMADAVLLGKPPYLSLDYSRGNVATIVALLESARVGKPVAL